MIQLQNRTIQMASGPNADLSSTYNEEPNVAFSELLPVRERLRGSKYLLQPMEDQDHTDPNGTTKLTKSEILLPKVNI